VIAEPGDGSRPDPDSRPWSGRPPGGDDILEQGSDPMLTPRWPQQRWQHRFAAWPHRFAAWPHRFAPWLRRFAMWRPRFAPWTRRLTLHAVAAAAFAIIAAAVITPVIPTGHKGTPVSSGLPSPASTTSGRTPGPATTLSASPTASPTPTPSPSPTPTPPAWPTESPVSASPPGLNLAALAAASLAGPAAGPGTGTFVGIGPNGTLGVFSAGTGALEQTLVPQETGGGAWGPVLTDDGRLVVLSQGVGTCADNIDTVPVGGGSEHTLIGFMDSGPNNVTPVSFALSADGTYLAYEMVTCSNPYATELYVVSLRTGQAVSEQIPYGYALVFTADDSLALFYYLGSGSDDLVVLQVPSLQEQTYPGPPGCIYTDLTAMSAGLVALMDCGTGNDLSIATISPTTFTQTGTVADLGSCLVGLSISAAGQDGSDLLAEDAQGCPAGQLPQPTGQVSVLQVLSGQTVPVWSGPYDGDNLPQDVAW
jgi:hypothetical protein